MHTQRERDLLVDAASFEEKSKWADVFTAHINFAVAKRAFTPKEPAVFVPLSNYKIYAPESDAPVAAAAGGGGGGISSTTEQDDSNAAFAESASAAEVGAKAVAPRQTPPDLYVPFNLLPQTFYSGAVPETVSGFLRKQSGLLINWHQRFFIVELGVLRFYIGKSLSPPYGLEERGALALTGYSCVPVPGFNSRLRLVAPSMSHSMFNSSRDIQVDAADETKLGVWMEVLQEHIRFADEKEISAPLSTGPKSLGARF